MEETTAFEDFDLRLTEESKSFLKETAKWAYFLSIVGFVGVGILVLFALFFGTIFSKLSSFGGNSTPMPMMAGGFITVLYLVIAVIYFFPVYYLFQFSSKLKIAFNNIDNEQLTASFENLKSHYKFMGICAIVMISLYGVIFLFSLIGLAFAA
ncbi:DUF5362 family protein [Flavobacterium seoulense]|uniref:DUF5362 domain-containing protein n=1 Tax=Flavobacterium seoulense TaxID=1492738 RepID=A0A066WZZ6_9FLAO|nr:DUF5362 family protein [Flavobacterium seoulense]KDN56494.1 hypothetical protein FEM21_05130 [Flavobacterium seoulense]